MEAIHLHSINRRVMHMSWAVSSCVQECLFLSTYLRMYMCAVLVQWQCVWQCMLHGAPCRPPSASAQVPAAKSCVGAREAAAVSGK